VNPQPSLDYVGPGGTCVPYILGYYFWIGFLDVLFLLGSRASLAARYNTFRATPLRGCACCVAVYSWQLFSLVTVLDVVAAFVLEAGGCHFGPPPPRPALPRPAPPAFVPALLPVLTPRRPRRAEQASRCSSRRLSVSSRAGAPACLSERARERARIAAHQRRRGGRGCVGPGSRAGERELTRARRPAVPLARWQVRVLLVGLPRAQRKSGRARRARRRGAVRHVPALLLSARAYVAATRFVLSLMCGSAVSEWAERHGDCSADGQCVVPGTVGAGQLAARSVAERVSCEWSLQFSRAVQSRINPMA